MSILDRVIVVTDVSANKATRDAPQIMTLRDFCEANMDGISAEQAIRLYEDLTVRGQAIILGGVGEVYKITFKEFAAPRATARDIGLAIRDFITDNTFSMFVDDQELEDAGEIVEVDVSDAEKPILCLDNGQEFRVEITEMLRAGESVG